MAFRRLFDEGMIPATARRLFSTLLRTALNAAARERLIPDNPARYVKLPRGARPHAVVWTRRRVREWKQTGIRPAVAVWTPAQLAQFLSFVGSHRLFAVFHLIAMRGLRRGEACGLKWEDLDLDEGLAYLSRQVQEGPDGRLRACPLKTESSRRAVAMDPQTVTVLRAHRSWQSRWLSESSIETQGAGCSIDEIGRPISPDCLHSTFIRLAEESGLPPVRLHDLRHGAATLMLLAGDELKTIADQLGHSSVVLTADTYLSVAVELGLQVRLLTRHGPLFVPKAGQATSPGGGDVRRRGAPVLVEITV